MCHVFLALVSLVNRQLTRVMSSWHAWPRCVILRHMQSTSPGQLLLPPLLAPKAFDRHGSSSGTLPATTEQFIISLIPVLDDSLSICCGSRALQMLLSHLCSERFAEVAAKHTVKMVHAPNKLWLSRHKSGLFFGIFVVIQSERPPAQAAACVDSLNQ